MGQNCLTLAWIRIRDPLFQKYCGSPNDAMVFLLLDWYFDIPIFLLLFFSIFTKNVFFFQYWLITPLRGVRPQYRTRLCQALGQQWTFLRWAPRLTTHLPWPSRFRTQWWKFFELILALKKCMRIGKIKNLLYVVGIHLFKNIFPSFNFFDLARTTFVYFLSRVVGWSTEFSHQQLQLVGWDFFHQCTSLLYIIGSVYWQPCMIFLIKKIDFETENFVL